MSGNVTGRVSPRAPCREDKALLEETDNGHGQEGVGLRFEEVIKAVVLEKLECLLEDTAQSRIMDAKEAAAFLHLSPSEFRKLAARESYPGTPSTGRVTGICAANCWSGLGGACDGN